jgi:hypothetical protein
MVLLVAGMLFMVTACSYFVMTLKGRDMGYGDQQDASNQRFVEIVDRYGFTALMIELGVLAAATVGIIATDEYWERRAGREVEENSNEESEEPNP